MLAKYSDKCKECESYINISEHRFNQYTELMIKQNLIDKGKVTASAKFDEDLQAKDDEI